MFQEAQSTLEAFAGAYGRVFIFSTSFRHCFKTLNFFKNKSQSPPSCQTSTEVKEHQVYEGTAEAKSRIGEHIQNFPDTFYIL